MKKLSVLELYEKKGLLNYGSKRWTSTDRLIAGRQLLEDYYKSGISSVKAIDYSIDKVDGSSGCAEGRLIALDRYNKAIRVLDAKQLKVITKVVLFNEKWKPLGSERIRAHKMYLAMHVLCWGLDRLISHYLKKKQYKVQSQMELF